MASNSFRQVLIKLLQDSESHPGDITKQIKDAFISFGSETPDNLNAVQHINYDIAKGGFEKQAFGFCLQHKPVLISSILNALENAPTPSEIREYYPDITEEEWQAVTRLVTMVFLAFEHKVTGSNNSSQED